MRRFILALVVLCVFITPALAQDGNWYASLKGGISSGPEASAADQGVSLTLDTDVGAALMGSVGYAWENGVRLEGEVSWRDNELGDVDVRVGNRQGTVDVDGSVTNVAFMVNGAYEVALSPLLTPYLMAGLGVARLESEVSGLAGTSIQWDDDKTVFAYQAGVGVAYPLTPEWSFDVSYRFFGTEDVTFDDVTVTNTHHTGLFGLAYAF